MSSRREFMTLLGGAAAAWPLAARAQQPQRIRLIGVLLGTREDDPQRRAQLAAFVQRLTELGWADGRNARLDVRWTAGSVDTARKPPAPPLHRAHTGGSPPVAGSPKPRLGGGETSSPA